MDKPLLLKDKLFGNEQIATIATQIKAVYCAFDDTSFVLQTLQRFPTLELKARIYHIRDMLYAHLPKDYKTATQILINALPAPLVDTRSDNDFGEFIYAPYGEFVACYGCSQEHLDFSLEALREITKRFSVEYAIRDFINAFPVQTLAMLEACAYSQNYHERRLASEGVRPKLPWAKKIDLDYTRPLGLLEHLYIDKTRYVTRSVANHLNDISKIDAPLVLETLKRWQISNKQDPKEMMYIITHALRTLVKKGDEEALALLGYMRHPAVEIKAFVLHTPVLYIGQSMMFDLVLVATEQSSVLLDYVVYFQTKTGVLSPKVHKLKKLHLQKGQSVHLQKTHPLPAGMSTRTLYAGEHAVALQINGVLQTKEIFMLKEAL